MYKLLSKTCNGNFVWLAKMPSNFTTFPNSPSPKLPSLFAPTLPTIRRAISATRHLLELFRLQLEDDNARRKLRRLTQRLFNIGRELDHLTSK
jgi:hypothetical protein